MVKSSFALVSIVVLAGLGCFLTWVGYRIIKRSGSSVFGNILIVVGNGLLFAPLTLLVVGHGMVGYAIAGVLNLAFAFYLLNKIDSGTAH